MKRRISVKFFVSLFVACFMAFSLSAAETERGFSGGAPRERGNHRRGGGFFGRTEAELAIAEKYPAETAELDRQLLEIEKKYEELAKKAGVEWPASMENNIRKLRAADPKGFQEVMEAMKKDRRAGMQQMMELARKNNMELMPMGGPGGGRRRGPDAVSQPPAREKVPSLAQLRKKYPEEMKEYERLNKEDKEKAKQYLLELMNR